MFHVLEEVEVVDGLSRFVMRFADVDRQKCFDYASETGKVCLICKIEGSSRIASMEGETACL